MWTSNSIMQGQFYFPKSGGAGKEHGLHLGIKGGVPGAGPNPRHLWSSPGPNSRAAGIHNISISGSRYLKLGVVYTMDHEAVPRPCKIYNWMLNSSQDHFGLHQGENIKVTMKFEVHKRLILRPTISANIVQHVLLWESQKSCFGRKGKDPWQRNIAIIIS